MKEYIYSNNQQYKIVDKIPKGYSIWNIGSKNMIDDYLPLCEPIEKDSYSINPNTLKAIKVNGAKEILDVVGYGYCGRTGRRRMYRDLSEHKCTKRQRELIIKALPYIKELKWE